MLFLCSFHLGIALLCYSFLISILHLEFNSLDNSLFLSLLCSGCIVGSIVGKTAVELLQVRNYLFSIVGFPEFEVRTTLQKLTHALGFFDTWHLNHNAAGLSFEFLDVGLYDTKLVNTGANNVERVVNGSLNFLTKHFLYF